MLLRLPPARHQFWGIPTLFPGRTVRPPPRLPGCPGRTPCEKQRLKLLCGSVLKISKQFAKPFLQSHTCFPPVTSESVPKPYQGPATQVLTSGTWNSPDHNANLLSVLQRGCCLSETSSCKPTTSPAQRTHPRPRLPLLCAEQPPTSCHGRNKRHAEGAVPPAPPPGPAGPGHGRRSHGAVQVRPSLIAVSCPIVSPRARPCQAGHSQTAGAPRPKAPASRAVLLQARSTCHMPRTRLPGVGKTSKLGPQVSDPPDYPQIIPLQALSAPSTRVPQQPCCRGTPRRCAAHESMLLGAARGARGVMRFQALWHCPIALHKGGTNPVQARGRPDLQTTSSPSNHPCPRPPHRGVHQLHQAHAGTLP